MEERVRRIGQVLIESKLIDRDQLNILLEEQNDHPHMNLGEMAANRFGIPISDVESVFVEHIVLPSVRTLLLRALTQELSQYVANTDFEIENLSLDMSINELEIARTVSSYFQSSPSDKNRMEPNGKSSNTKIHGSIYLSIAISEDTVITPPNELVPFTLDDRTGALSLEQTNLDRIKHSFIQAIKKDSHPSPSIDPASEEELKEIISRYYNT